MKILLKNAKFLDGTAGCVAVDGRKIAYVGQGRPEGVFDREVDCRGNLLTCGLYNLHTHAAMTFIRGYGEDLPLQEWLDTKVYPAEEALTEELVTWASYLAMAEMIRGGIVSFTDMYYFCEATARGVIESGMKANLSRSLVSFTPGMRAAGDSRFEEAKSLVREYHNSAEGRLRVDLSLHAEYTNVESYIRDVADYGRDEGLGMHIHLSETRKEHEECLARYGRTPTAFFRDCGVLDMPTQAAHCVFCTEEDMDILAAKGATAVHDPCSNLKLGSGVMPLETMIAHGVNVAMGTDSACSNNRLDIFREMYVASLLAKGLSNDPTAGSAQLILKLATENGAKGQGRPDSGRLAPGYAADLILLDLSAVNNIPAYDYRYTMLYSASSRDVLMTMADGKVLYENGEYTTLDVEKIKAEFKRVWKY